MSSVRRSRRGDKHAFGVGDKVEILRDDGVAIATLVGVVHDSDNEEAASSSSSSPKPATTNRWHVQFEGESEDEEVSEKLLGRLVSTAGSDEGSESSFKTDEVVKPTLKPSSKAEASSKPKARGKPKRKGDLTKEPSRKAARRPQKMEKDESVVVVKMLTGTLYLFRGANPRAEFVRVV